MQIRELVPVGRRIHTIIKVTAEDYFPLFLYYFPQVKL